jgi:hypothetical protein
MLTKSSWLEERFVPVPRHLCVGKQDREHPLLRVKEPNKRPSDAFYSAVQYS